MDICDFYGLTGRVVTPEDPEYNLARQEFNRAIQKFPLAIVYCANKTDVSNAILWSEKHNVCLRVRNGGHNYAGYSTGNGVLVIDLSGLDELRLDEERNLLTVGGGVKNRRLYEFISSRGYPFPGGTCPTVGVSGYALGGGWGLSCRSLGLGCDSLTQLELVNYEGIIQQASPKQNPDLFWACRGAGGGNFGVVVSMTFGLPPKTGKVTLVEIRYPKADAQKQARFLEAWQDWLRCADEKITLQASIYNDAAEGLGVYSRGIYYGPPGEAERSVLPLTGLGGVKLSFRYLTFFEAITRIGDSYAASEKFVSASRFVQRDFSPSQCEKLVGLIQERAKGSVYANLAVYALGGRVADVPRNATAFFYRDAHYIIHLDTVFEDNCYAPANADWLSKRYRSVTAITKGSYVNFPYAGLPNYLEAYYGAHVCRLKTIKARYDPGNVFTFPQGIDGRTGGYPDDPEDSDLAPMPDSYLSFPGEEL